MATGGIIFESVAKDMFSYRQSDLDPIYWIYPDTNALILPTMHLGFASPDHTQWHPLISPSAATFPVPTIGFLINGY